MTVVGDCLPFEKRLKPFKKSCTFLCPISTSPYVAIGAYNLDSSPSDSNILVSLPLSFQFVAVFSALVVTAVVSAVYDDLD